MEFDLYTIDGSIMFSDKTKLQKTNAKTTTMVASGFRFVNGFKQLNSSHVAVVDRARHCIKIVNRENSSYTVYVGTCDASGFVDGRSAKFSFPFSVEIDERNPGHLLVTDHRNHALRSFEVTSGAVSTVIKTGFNYPKGLTWYDGHLLVSNNHYISEVSWSSNGAVSNNKLTTTTTYGYKNGDFSIAQFEYPHEIKQIREGLFLVADQGNSKLRLLNMSTRKVLPVCISFSAPCTTGTTLSYPLFILVSEEEVYVGGYKEIHKLTGKLQ